MFFWEWPLAPDRVRPRLRQLERDWIWYEAWHRYAWRADRDPEAERTYWIGRLAEQFGTHQAGAAALDAYEAIGRIAPQLVRRFGITEGNRQTLSLGMTMSQLTNATRYRPWADLWESHAPAGERLDQYVARELAGEPHLGETPVDVIRNVRRLADVASAAIDHGATAVRSNADQYERLRTDVEAISLIARFYALRVSAAIDIMTYRRTRVHHEHDPGELRTALSKVERSVAVYRDLAALTDRTYHYANSMRTPQRKIPFPDGAAFGHWRQCLPEYEAELTRMRRNIELLAAGRMPPGRSGGRSGPRPLRPVAFELHSSACEVFTLEEGSSVFADSESNIRYLADELAGLRGVRISRQAGYRGRVEVEFSLRESALVLIGYFADPDPAWLQVPDLETDTHADARGGLDPLLRNGIGVDFLPTVNVHALRYEPGRHLLAPGPGAYLIAGVIAADQQPQPREVAPDDSAPDAMDWLYEDHRDP